MLHGGFTEEWLAEKMAQGHVREVKPRQGASQPREPSTLAEPENRFLARVLTLAHQHGWTSYHTHDSRKSAPGFPDLILVKPGHPLLCIELKTNTGKPTMEQLQWLRLLQSSEKPQAALWRPQDWDSISTILAQHLERPIPCPAPVV